MAQAHAAVGSEPAIASILAEIGRPDGVTFADLVRHMRTIDPNRIALEFEDQKYSYAQALRTVAGVATYLQSLGIKRGDHVAYMFRGHPHALYTLLATTLLGAVLCPLNPELVGDVLAHRLEKYAIRAVVADESCFEHVVKIGATVSGKPLVINGHGEGFFEAVRRGADIDPLLEQADAVPSDPGLILSTSGTTGDPKGVVVSQSWVGGGLIVPRKWGCFAEPPREYLALSWGYSAAVWQTAIAYFQGGTVIIPRRFSASGLWDDFHRHHCNHVHLMGTMPRMLFAQPAKPSDNAHPRAIVTSAGMPADLWEDFERRFNVRIFECYSTVDSGGSWMTNDGSAPPGSVGRPWIEQEARLVDDDGNDVPDGEVGELLMRTRGVPPVVEYLGDGAASREKVSGGWVHLGDYFKRDASGNYWFVDRKRDLIRRRAMGISPNEVEKAFRAMSGIAEVSVFAVPADLGEDEIKIAILPLADASITPQAVAAFSSETLPRYMQPRYIEVVDALPRTFGTERVQRYKLGEQWATPQTWDTEQQQYLSV